MKRQRGGVARVYSFTKHGRRLGETCNESTKTLERRRAITYCHVTVNSLDSSFSVECRCLFQPAHRLTPRQLRHGMVSTLSLGTRHVGTSLRSQRLRRVPKCPTQRWKKATTASRVRPAKVKAERRHSDLPCSHHSSQLSARLLNRPARARNNLINACRTSIVSMPRRKPRETRREKAHG